MDLGLRGKSVIVTGGASNIGRAIALAFMKEGSNLVIADIDVRQADNVISSGKQAGPTGLSVARQTDVTDAEQVERLVVETVEKFGALDILVNGVGWTVDRLFLEKPRKEWEKEIELNLWGAINCIRAALPSMVARGSGRIVTISSDAGRIGEYREAVYSACKAGLIGLTKALAREVGPYNICLNTVCPGLTVPAEGEIGENSMWAENIQIFTADAREKAAKRYPLRRLGTASDVANAVVFLSSDAAGFITGQTLSVSGGYSMA